MKYTVEYSGSVEVDAGCELEAECTAATMCRPDNCRVVVAEQVECTHCREQYSEFHMCKDTQEPQD